MTEHLRRPSSRSTAGHGTGNEAAILQRRCACGTHGIAGGACPECARRGDVPPPPRQERGASGTAAGERGGDLLSPGRFARDFSGIRAGTDDTVGGTSGPGAGPAQKDGAEPTEVRPGEASAMCTVSEEIPRNRSGIINGGGEVGERFDVAITWRESPHSSGAGMSACRCRCGEYRQYVKGHLIINGHPEALRLYGGALLEESVYHEDGRDTEPTKRYGHRAERQTMDEDYLPDRTTGCSYIGRDFPRVMIGSDTDMLFKFKGQTFDTCSNAFGPAHEWEVRYAGPIRR